MCFREFVEEPAVPEGVACSEFSFFIFIGVDRADPFQLLLGRESVRVAWLFSSLLRGLAAGDMMFIRVTA